ncbi:MAG TPA: M56 family metallopeptidase [Thermoanaerobaculia bacterium]|nr:M56 family metallopeptidase [Thermoanaerobaculia bacterium]
MTSLFELAARLQSANAAEGMLWMIVKITLILAIARLLLAALPRASAAMKHAIATAALIGVALLPTLSAITPAIELNVGRASARPAVSAGRAEARPTSVIGVGDGESIATAISVVKATGLAEKPLTLLERSMHLVQSTWKGMIVVSAAAIALFLLVHMAAGMAGVWLVSRRAEELTGEAALRELDAARDHLALGRDVRLLKSDRVAVPVVWGIFKPVLLLPADVEEWPAERLRVVLLHELAHLKRWDGLSLILTRIAVSLFWFHPLAWSLERAGRSECERACDDLVLASGTKPSDYADHLLAIAREMPAFDPFRSVTLAMSRKSQLEGRLLSILQRDVARRVFSGRGVAVACALAVAVIAPIAAMRLVAKPSEEKDKTPVVKEEKLKSDAEVTVTPEIEAISDMVFTKLGGTPSTGRGWYDRAYDLYHDEKWPEAAVAFRRAADEGFKVSTSLYNAACSHALAGDAGRAVEELGRAIDAGWDDYDAIAEDSDFDAIRDDGRFRQLVGARLGEAVNRRTTETVEKYQTLRTYRAKDGEEWFDVGVELLRLRKLDESIDAFEHAIADGDKAASSMYNTACAYSLKQDVRNGMAWLRKAIDAGYSGGDHLVKDSDIALLRKQPEFAELRELAKDLEMRGCCSGPVSFIYDDWRESAKHHQKMVQKHPRSGRAWFNLGFTSLQARDFPTAIDAFHRASDLGYRPGTSAYNIACAYALQENRDAAFQWLEKARTAGFDVADHADDDEDLNALHRDPRWREVVTN